MSIHEESEKTTANSKSIWSGVWARHKICTNVTYFNAPAHSGLSKSLAQHTRCPAVNTRSRGLCHAWCKRSLTHVENHSRQKAWGQGSGSRLHVTEKHVSSKRQPLFPRLYLDSFRAGQAGMAAHKRATWTPPFGQAHRSAHEWLLSTPGGIGALRMLCQSRRLVNPPAPLFLC